MEPHPLFVGYLLAVATRSELVKFDPFVRRDPFDPWVHTLMYRFVWRDERGESLWAGPVPERRYRKLAVPISYRLKRALRRVVRSSESGPV